MEGWGQGWSGMAAPTVACVLPPTQALPQAPRLWDGLCHLQPPRCPPALLASRLCVTHRPSSLWPSFFSLSVLLVCRCLLTSVAFSLSVPFLHAQTCAPLPLSCPLVPRLRAGARSREVRRVPASLAPLAVTLEPLSCSLAGQHCPRPPSSLLRADPLPGASPPPRPPPHMDTRPSIAQCVLIVDVQLAFLLFGSRLKCPGPAQQPSDRP